MSDQERAIRALESIANSLAALLALLIRKS